MLKITDRLKSFLIAFIVIILIQGSIMYFQFEKDLSVYLLTCLYVVPFLMIGSILGYIIDSTTYKYQKGRIINYLLYLSASLLLALPFIDFYLSMSLTFSFSATVLWLTNQYFLKLNNKSSK